MTDIEAKRDYVSKMYDRPGWKRQVRKMSDSQIVAIYLRELAKGEEKPKKPKESDDGEPSF
jgi:hypothetical protein